MSSENEPPVHTSPRQALLGLFILFQLGFLIVSNLLPFIRWVPDHLPQKPQAMAKQAAPGLTDTSSHMGKWAGHVEENLGYWGQLVGQEQQWSLFAPTVGTASGFPCVVLVWDTPTPRRSRLERPGLWDVLLLRKKAAEFDFDTEITPAIRGTRFAYDPTTGFHLCAEWNPGAPNLPLPIACRLSTLGSISPWDALTLTTACESGVIERPQRVEVMLSANEPADIKSFCRFGRTRLRRYEGQFWCDLRPYEKETPDELASRITNKVSELVKQYEPYLVKYMNWRLEAWKADHPEEVAPRYVMLFQRMYHIPKPTEDRRELVGPILQPIARWLPERKRTRDLDYFSYVTQAFENLSQLPQDE